jgi:hypothetical protein
MTKATDKVIIECSEGYRQPERNRADAEAWLERHQARAAADTRMCQGTHTIVEKESTHA